jgi:hypothetical protein
VAYFEQFEKEQEERRKAQNLKAAQRRKERAQSGRAHRDPVAQETANSLKQELRLHRRGAAPELEQPRPDGDAHALWWIRQSIITWVKSARQLLVPSAEE